MSDMQLIYEELGRLEATDDKITAIQNLFANSGLGQWMPARGANISPMQMAMLTQLDPYYCAVLVGPEQWNSFCAVMTQMVVAHDKRMHSTRTARRLTENIIGL